MRQVEIAYEPFGAQVTAHQAPEDTVFLAGGWGSGKTAWLIAEALRNTVKNPGLSGLLVSPTFPLQRRTIYRSIVDFFPEATRWPTGSAKASDCLGPLVRDWSARARGRTMGSGSSRSGTGVSGPLAAQTPRQALKEQPTPGAAWMSPA